MRLFAEFKGALTENYCISQMLATHHQQIHYYTFDNYYEVDFLMQRHNQIFPIEVKSGANVRHASLTRYNEVYRPGVSVRFSANNLTLDGNILNASLYLAEYVDKMVNLS